MNDIPSSVLHIRKTPLIISWGATTTVEDQDLGNINLNELIGALQTFEKALNDRFEKKNKSINFVSNTEE